MIQKQYIGIKTALDQDEEIIMEYTSGGHNSSREFRKIRVKDISRYLSDVSNRFYRITPISVNVTLGITDD